MGMFDVFFNLGYGKKIWTGIIWVHYSPHNYGLVNVLIEHHPTKYWEYLISNRYGHPREAADHLVGYTGYIRKYP